MAKEKRYTITILAPGRYVGVREAADGLGVRRQAIYLVINGYERALGPAKRSRLRIVDRTR